MQTLSYAAARAQMRTGDPLCTDTPGLIGAGIKAVTRGPVSHTAGVIELTLAGVRRLFVAEATHHHGVALVALSVWLQQRAAGPIYWWPAGFTDEEREAYAAEVLSHVGEPYEADKWMLTRVALRLPPPENSRWFCSELDAAGRRAARPVPFCIKWPKDKAVWPVDTARAYGGLKKAYRILPVAP